MVAFATFETFEAIGGLSHDAHERARMNVAWFDFLGLIYRRHAGDDLTFSPF